MSKSIDLIISEWQSPHALSGTERLDYCSPVDGLDDWALALPPADKDRPWVLYLHGHGATGDQIFSRQDVRETWLLPLRERGVGILAPNLRGNNWMGPAAATDLHALLAAAREGYGATEFALLCGSMGGTGGLIYATLHPEDISLLLSLCPATDIAEYHSWCIAHEQGRPTITEIRSAIEAAYGGTPASAAEIYQRHSALENAEKLALPVLVVHGDEDATIPVEGSRRLAQKLHSKKDFEYIEIAGGNHDAPITEPGAVAWIMAKFFAE